MRSSSDKRTALTRSIVESIMRDYPEQTSWFDELPAVIEAMTSLPRVDVMPTPPAPVDLAEQMPGYGEWA